MDDGAKHEFTPADTQQLDTRGLNLDRQMTEEGRQGQDEESGETRIESIQAGVEALLSEDGDRPETIDAANSYIARNSDNLSADEAANLRELIESRKDGNPEKRRQALEAIYAVLAEAKSEADAAKRVAETKKVDQTSRLMDTWEREITAQANKDGVDVMKNEFAGQLDKWANQIDSISSPEADRLRARIAQARTEFLRGGSV